MMPENSTLEWYRKNLEDFIAGTVNADLTPQYQAFLEYLPYGGSILDLGCGAGSAALYFTQMGYQVLAVDGCRELCDYTQHRVGCPVRCMLFDKLDYMDMFDGVWACASLLHVSWAELPSIFRLIRRALKKDGVFYSSFKYGETERIKDGRAFSDFTEESLRSFLTQTEGFQEIKLWTTNDVRSGRAEERWINALFQAK